MPNELATINPAGALTTGGSGFILPAVIADQGDKAAERFFTFFTDTIPNANTRAAYYRNTMRFFAWTHAKGLEPARDQELSRLRLPGRAGDRSHATPTVKQHLASLRMLFDWLITGQIIEANPAAAVRAAKHVVKKGKTPVLKADQARELLDSIPLKIGPEPKEGEPDNRPPSLIGLRDRALIAVMVFSFARITAALGMKVEDYYTEGRRAWFRLHEKGGKRHEVPAHHNAEDYLDAYIAAAGIADDEEDPPLPLHRPAPPAHRPPDAPHRRLADDQTPSPGHRPARRHLQPHLPGHRHHRLPEERRHHRARPADRQPRSPKTTKLYDRTSDQITLDEVERIVI